MKLSNYVKGLFPSFKRDKIIDSLNATKEMIVKQTIPAYETGADLFKDRSFKSKKLKDFVKLYSSNVQNVTDAKLLFSILSVLKNSVTLLDYIDNVSKNEFSDVETNVTLTIKKSTFLRTIQAAEFLSTYSRKFLNYVFVLETQEASEHTTVKNTLLDIEVNWIESNFYNFCIACKILTTAKDRFKNDINNIPDAVISDMSDLVLPETVGASKLDPIKMNALTVSWNPFYLLGMMMAGYQAEKYKTAEAELSLLQMRKLRLEQLYSSKPDPKLEKEINYLQNRVDKLQYKLEEMREDYGV